MKRLAWLDNFIFAKRGFLESAKFEDRHLFMGVVMEAAKTPRLPCARGAVSEVD